MNQNIRASSNSSFHLSFRPDRLQQDIAELRDRKDALEEKVRDLHKVSDQSWLDIKTSLDRDIERLEAAYSAVSENNK